MVVSQAWPCSPCAEHRRQLPSGQRYHEQGNAAEEQAGRVARPARELPPELRHGPAIETVIEVDQGEQSGDQNGTGDESILEHVSFNPVHSWKEPATRRPDRRSNRPNVHRRAGGCDRAYNPSGRLLTVRLHPPWTAGPRTRQTTWLDPARDIEATAGSRPPDWQPPRLQARLRPAGPRSRPSIRHR